MYHSRTGFTTAWKSFSGMGSLIFNMLLVMPVMLVMFAANEDEDDLLEYLRYRVGSFTYIGWGIGQLINVIYLMSAIYEGDKKAIDKEVENLNPFGFSIPFYP